jgi:hypothetical protein
MSEKDNLPEAEGVKEEIIQKEAREVNTFEGEKASKLETETTTAEVFPDETPVDRVDPNETEPESQSEGIEKVSVDSKEYDEEPSTEESSNSEATITPEEAAKKVLNEIESSNAEDAEDEHVSKRHIIEQKDYHSMSMEELVTEFETLMKNEKIQAIRNHVEKIRSEFSTKFGTVLAAAKEDFLSKGGNSIDFRFNSPLKSQFNNLLSEYREKRQDYYKNLEKTLKENLENRLEIIDEIKSLLNVEENINTTYKHFKALQERWRNTGPIPRDKYNNVWNNYHHHVENFYDFLHLNRDLRDLDFKHNLEQKQKIVARAEELARDDNSNRAFRELQVLHKIWKEELGPVAKEYRDEIWQRFSAATKAIHEKRQVYFKELDKVYEVNLNKKQEIISQINAITESEGNNHASWQKKIKEIETLREQFFKAGKVPIKVNEATWAKFKESVRAFNRKKNAFYKGLKKEQYENLQKKIELIKIAEDNKDNEDFDTTTSLMKKIQSDWKKIGHVPRRESDKIWKQFKTACNHYFDRFHAQRNEENKEEVEAFEKKSELLEKLMKLEFSDDNEVNLEQIKSFISEWKTLGRVPYSKRFINRKFSKTIDAVFNKLNVSRKEVELLKYDNKLDELFGKNDKHLIDNEHNFIKKRIDEIKSEINQLENNLLFFSNVDDDNPVVKEANINIERHKASLALWEAKLKKVKGYI